MKIYKRKTSFLTFLACVVLSTLFFVNGFETYHILMAVLFFIFSIIALLHKTGIEISKETKIRWFNSVLGYTFGKWEKLPDIKHVAVVRAKQYKYRMTGGFVDQVKSNRIIYQINIVFGDGKYKRLLSTNKADKSIHHALRLGKYLDVKVLDSTIKDIKWIR